MKVAAIGSALASLLFATPSLAQTTDAVIRVVDTGPGLCVVASIPGGHDLLYDAGHWNGQHCANAVREIVADGVIDLVVISHSDGDHLGQLDTILSQTRATHIIHTGHPGTSGAWEDAMEAVDVAGRNGTVVTNLGVAPIAPGTSFRLGDATVTFVAGWNNWDLTNSTGPLTPAERRNAVSIVVRLDYGGKSILLTGDTIGRAIGSPRSTCDHAERWMVTNQSALLRADILFAPHHGGDNGSSSCFISAVQPRYVIFSAGHNHRHPTAATASRYWPGGNAPRGRSFRTDYGDDEGTGEWVRGRRPGCEDLPGDDDIEIRLAANPNTRASVRYMSAVRACR